MNALYDTNLNGGFKLNLLANALAMPGCELSKKGKECDSDDTLETPELRRSVRGCVKKKRFPSPSSIPAKKKARPQLVGTEDSKKSSEWNSTIKTGVKRFRLKKLDERKSDFFDKVESHLRPNFKGRHPRGEEVKSNGWNSSIPCLGNCEEVNQFLHLLHSGARPPSEAVTKRLLEKFVAQTLFRIGLNSGRIVADAEQNVLYHDEHGKETRNKHRRQYSGLVMKRVDPVAALDRKFSGLSVPENVENTYAAGYSGFMESKPPLIPNLKAGSPCCSGGGSGSFLTIRQTVHKASAETPVTMSVVPSPVNRTQRRSRQGGVDFWEPKVRRTVGGSLDKEIKAAEELDRRVEEFRRLLSEMTLSDEARDCCDQIIQAVGVIREENDSTRKKNVSLRKIIKELRHSKSDSAEEDILESKNKLLQEKVHADIQLELQARTIHEQAERIRVLELQLQDRDGNTNYWPQMNNANGPPSFNESSSVVGADSYTELRTVNGPIVMNEPGSTSLAPLQTVSVNATDEYPSQPYYDGIPCQDRHENAGSNSWMLSPENSWMLKC